MAAKKTVPASDQRRELIAKLEKIRGRRVITYITTTRPNNTGSMTADAIPVIYDHLRALGLSPCDRQPLDLFLHTYGGDSTVPWRLMSLLREFASEVALLVPHYAFSAGTLAALGADEVVMHPMGVLGPTDMSVQGAFNPLGSDRRLLPIEVEDVRSYIEWVKEDVGIRHEDELVEALGYLAGPDRIHPLALGLVKRSVQQSRLMGERLLGRRRTGADDEKMSKHDVEELIEGLTARLFHHGHPINRQEARNDLNLTWVKDATEGEAAAMWALYEAYDREMRLSEEFSATREAIAKLGDVPALPGYPEDGREPPPTVVEVDLDPLQMARVESEVRRDCYEDRWRVTLQRHADGTVDARYVMVESGWRAA